MTLLPHFIDIEASSLSDRSYPIEVGICYPNYSTTFDLIDPSGVFRWTDWSTTAESVHGISRQTLHDQGKPPAFVARSLSKMNDILFVSDNPDFDNHWINELFEACGSTPDFRIVGIPEAMQQLMGRTISNDDLRTAQKSVIKLFGQPPHRAAADALWMRRLWDALTGENSHPYKHYCWRCKKPVHLLTDDEFEKFNPIVNNRGPFSTRLLNCAFGLGDLTEPIQDSQDMYLRLIGEPLPPEDYYNMRHHYLSYWGGACHVCGQLLRTPDANFCAQCGAQPQDGD